MDNTCRVDVLVITQILQDIGCLCLPPIHNRPFGSRRRCHRKDSRIGRKISEQDRRIRPEITLGAWYRRDGHCRRSVPACWDGVVGLLGFHREVVEHEGPELSAAFGKSDKSKNTAEDSPMGPRGQ